MLDPIMDKLPSETPRSHKTFTKTRLIILLVGFLALILVMILIVIYARQIRLKPAQYQSSQYIFNDFIQRERTKLLKQEDESIKGINVVYDPRSNTITYQFAAKSKEVFQFILKDSYQIESYTKTGLCLDKDIQNLFNARLTLQVQYLWENSPFLTITVTQKSCI